MNFNFKFEGVTSMTYMTRQQQAVLACIERFGGGCATAAELTEELHREGQ